MERAIPDNWTLSFGASRRISRPDPAFLNPYVDHEYTPNLQAGNSRLRPQHSESFELGIGYEGKGRSCSLTGYYRRNQDTVTDVTVYLANGLSLTTKTNLPKDTSCVRRQ